MNRHLIEEVVELEVTLYIQQNPQLMYLPQMVVMVVQQYLKMLLDQFWRIHIQQEGEELDLYMVLVAMVDKFLKVYFPLLFFPVPTKLTLHLVAVV